MISSEMIEATPSKGGRGRGVLHQLTKDLKEVRRLLQPMAPLKGASVEEQKEKATVKLVKAIDVAERLASTAKMTSEKGMLT